MKNKKLTVLLVAVVALAVMISVSIAAASGNLAFWSDDGTAERQEIEKTHNVQLAGGDELTVTYDMSRATGEQIADIYKDDKGNDYIYKNGKLTGFYSNEIKNPAADCKAIGKDKAEKIALTFLSSFTDNVKEYSLRDFEEKENYGQYYFTYARKLGDVFTDEYAKISVMYDGGVKSVSLFNEGKYEGVDAGVVEGIAEDVIYDFAVSELKIIYPQETSEFEMTKYYLTSDDNGYYISVSGNFGDRFESVRYYLED